MASAGRVLARQFARVAAPSLRSLGLTHGLMEAETYLAFLSGRGGGSGWDMPGQAAAIASFMPRGPAEVLDVGANNGEWSRLLAKIRNQPADKFHLFECAPYCFDGIERRRGEIPNMRLEKVAVSDKLGNATLHLPTKGSGLASLHERHDVSVVAQTYVEHEVKTLPLDYYIHEHQISKVDLLKIDIEGHEIHALNGASQSIAEGIIKTVVFEFGSANVNSRSFFKDFWQFFVERGYNLHRIIPGGKTLTVKRYSETLEYFRGSTNYIATSSR